MPGHGPLVTQSPFEAYARYLRELSASIDAVGASGLSVSEAVETIALDDAYRAGPDTPVPAAFVEGLHQFNVAVAYQRQLGD